MTYTHNTLHNSKKLEDFKQKIYLRTFTLLIFNPLKSRLTITTPEIGMDNRKLLSWNTKRSWSILRHCWVVFPQPCRTKGSVSVRSSALRKSSKEEIPTGKQLIKSYDNSTEFVEVEKDKPSIRPTPEGAHSETAAVLLLKHRTKSTGVKPPKTWTHL